MCPGPPAPAGLQNTYIQEEDETICEDETSMMDNTLMVDQRYQGLLKLIDDLKNQLIKEKQDRLKQEQEIRSELCKDFNQMLVEIESDWNKRLKDESER